MKYINFQVGKKTQTDALGIQSVAVHHAVDGESGRSVERSAVARSPGADLPTARHRVRHVFGGRNVRVVVSAPLSSLARGIFFQGCMGKLGVW